MYNEIDVTQYNNTFKILFKRFLKEIYSITINDICIRNIFLETLLLLKNNENYSLLSEQICSNIDNIIIQNGYDDILLDYENMVEVYNIDILFNDIIDKFKNYTFIDYKINSTNIKILVQQENEMREIEEETELKKYLPLPQILIRYCFETSIDTTNINFYMLVNEMIDKALTLINSNGDYNLDLAINNMITHTYLTTKLNNVPFTMMNDETTIDVIKTSIFELMEDILMLEQYVLEINRYSFVVKHIVNEKIILIIKKR